MDTQRRIISTATCGLLLISMSATRFPTRESRTPASVLSDPVACTLLTAGDATTALEFPSKPGKELIDSKSCVWSNDPAASDSSRRVTLVINSLRALQFAKRPAITTIKIEPVSGIGDEAFYQIYPAPASPFIWVRKGSTAFDIRILTRLKPKPFTLEQEKSKEAVLAKAAAARL